MQKEASEQASEQTSEQTSEQASGQLVWGLRAVATHRLPGREVLNALRLLQTRRRTGRPKHVGDAIPNLESADKIDPGSRSSFRGIPSLAGMSDWLQRDTDVAALNIIHVAGTKGKGSTCAFARSLLQEFGKRTGFPTKVGLYTSPHLTCIRERIQINGQPISEHLFTKYFFEIWDPLFSSQQVRDDDTNDNKKLRQPRYLQFLALLAIHTFCQEGIQAAIFETHHGGEYDATNVLSSPVVTGITSIGLDHLAQLGPDIETVAWHKAGIFKKGSSPAFSAPQSPPTVEAVLRARAAERDVRLEIVPADDPSLPGDANALLPPVQRINSSLAIALVNAFLTKRRPRLDDDDGENNERRLSEADIKNGIDHFSWPGRFEIIKSKNGCTCWYLDGAHNEFSIASSPPHRCMVIFSHVSEERDGPSLLRALARALERHADAIQSPDMLMMHRRGAEAAATTSTSASYVPSIEEALEYAERVSAERGGLHVLVTGSLHLVGGALYLLRRWETDER
ncbi:hypothetical protein DV736_g4379, partial [Chaetothyriales sp. CBS 134916]